MTEEQLIEKITRRIQVMPGRPDRSLVDRSFKQLGQQIFEMPESKMLAGAVAARARAGRVAGENRLDDLTRRVAALEQTRC